MFSFEKQRATIWSSEDDKVLIDFVKQNDSLYNIHSKDYRKIQMKQRLWNEIGGILHKTGTDCSKRWSYVRDYYIRRKGKLTTGSTGEAAKKRSEQLSFIDCCSGRRSNIEYYDMAEHSIDDIANEEQPSETIPTTNEDTVEELQFSNENVVDSTELQTIKTEETNHTTLFLGRKYQTLKAKNPRERLRLIRKVVEKRHQPASVPEQDENDLFFGSMAKIIKKLPETNQAQLRLQIGNLVGHAEIDFLSGSRLDNSSPFSAGYATSYEDSLFSHAAASSPSPSDTPGISSDDPIQFICS